MAIVYEHIRKDTGEAFYVGIGSRRDRATSKDGRTPHWHAIVDKCGYYIEILHEDISIDDAKLLETKYIQEIGRKDLNQGPLINLTDGGEGQFNPSEATIEKIRNAAIEQWKTYVPSDAARKKMSDAAKAQRERGIGGNNKPHSDEAKKKMSEARKEYWRKKKAGLL